jgi:hypothetical protein
MRDIACRETMYLPTVRFRTTGDPPLSRRQLNALSPPVVANAERGHLLGAEQLCTLH